MSLSRFLCRVMGHWWKMTSIAHKDQGSLMRCSRCGKTEWQRGGTA